MRAATAALFGRRGAVRLLPLAVRPLGVSLRGIATGGRGPRGSKGSKASDAEVAATYEAMVAKAEVAAVKADATRARAAAARARAAAARATGSKASEDEEALRALTNMLNTVTASGFPPPTATCDADADADDDDDDDDDPPVEQSPKRRRVEQSRTRSSLMRKTADTLEQMCEDAGLPSTGSKAQMVENLLTRRPAAARPTRLTPAMLGVGGLEAAVAELDTRVWLPHVAPAAAATRLDVTPPVGVLLYGPPGCGKSHLAVALAHAISPSRSPKIVKGPELKGALWGQDEHAVRDLFEEEDEVGRMDGVEGGAEAVRPATIQHEAATLTRRTQAAALRHGAC